MCVTIRVCLYVFVSVCKTRVRTCMCVITNCIEVFMPHFIMRIHTCNLYLMIASVSWMSVMENTLHLYVTSRNSCEYQILA